MRVGAAFLFLSAQSGQKLYPITRFITRSPSEAWESHIEVAEPSRIVIFSSVCRRDSVPKVGLAGTHTASSEQSQDWKEAGVFPLCLSKLKSLVALASVVCLVPQEVSRF